MMDDFEVIPGLVGEAVEDIDPSVASANDDGSVDLAAALDALSDDQVMDVVAEAQVAAEEGRLDDLLIASPSMDGEEPLPSEPEGESMPEMPLAEDPAATVEQVASLLDAVTGYQQSLTEMSEVNDASDADDVPEISEALETVVKSIADLEDALASAEKAADDQDPDAAADALKAAQEAKKAADEAFEAAKGAAHETASGIEETEPDPWTTWSELQ
jgi:hypothetical protein